MFNADESESFAGEAVIVGGSGGGVLQSNSHGYNT